MEVPVSSQKSYYQAQTTLQRETNSLWNNINAHNFVETGLFVGYIIIGFFAFCGAVYSVWKKFKGK